MMAGFFWLAVGVVAAVIEGLTTQLVSIWFAIAAPVAAIAALMGASPTVQLLLFVVVAGLLFLFTRPLVKKNLTVKKQPTNADQLLGHVGIVTHPTDPSLGSGRVMIQGLEWAARLQSDGELKPGDRVEVESIEGATLLVHLCRPE